MNLVLITWNGDLTQFLMESDGKENDIERAIRANKQIGKIDDEILDDMNNPDTYSIEDVDYNMLCGLFTREDTAGMYDDVFVFYD